MYTLYNEYYPFFAAVVDEVPVGELFGPQYMYSIRPAAIIPGIV